MVMLLWEICDGKVTGGPQVRWHNDERIAKRQRQRETEYIADCGSLLGQQRFAAASGSDGAGAVAIGCERMLLEPSQLQKA